MKYLLLVLLVSIFNFSFWAKVEVGDTWFMKLYWPLKAEEIYYPYKVFVIDLFDNDQTIIKKLKEQGKIVICYFSAGTWEDWRVDASSFPQEVLGKPLAEWEWERWLDISNYKKFENIIRDRIILAKNKWCDGVDPDNIDVYLNDSWFPISREHILDYYKFLASLAHSNGLLISLKNSPTIVKDVVKYSDFAVVEQCFQYNECDYYKDFINQWKPVFEVEYSLSKDKFCPLAKRYNFSSAKACRKLDWCWEGCNIENEKEYVSYYWSKIDKKYKLMIDMFFESLKTNPNKKQILHRILLKVRQYLLKYGKNQYIQNLLYYIYYKAKELYK